MTRKFIQRSIGNGLDIAGDTVTSYKPLSDEELAVYETKYIPNEWVPSMPEIKRLLEQARRANALAGAMHQWFKVSRSDQNWDAAIKALKAYRGEG